MRALILVIVSITSACTSESPIEGFCKRAQDCNILQTSVDECIDNLDHDRDQLSSADQGELDLSVQECLDHPSCDGFATCVTNLGN
jgi:hypothetical protein